MLPKILTNPDTEYFVKTRGYDFIPSIPVMFNGVRIKFSITDSGKICADFRDIYFALGHNGDPNLLPKGNRKGFKSPMLTQAAVSIGCKFYSMGFGKTYLLPIREVPAVLSRFIRMHAGLNGHYAVREKARKLAGKFIPWWVNEILPFVVATPRQTFSLF